MHIADFDYELPEHLIAQEPLAQRDASRLMLVLRAGGGVQHRRFTEVVECLRAGDVVVLNNSRVWPARVPARRPSGGQVEVFVLETPDAYSCRALVRPARRVRQGSQLLCNEGSVHGQVDAEGPGGERSITWDIPVHQLMHDWGETPLPPYIHRQPDALDRERYQTVYAQTEGSVAAPAAGLHWTPGLIDAIRTRGVHVVWVTLHVGYGTFQPVHVDDTTQHHMEAEWCEVSAEAVETISTARARGGRVVAVGTTTVRALESAALGGALKTYQGTTDLTITPPWSFQAVDGVITNFHLPRSSLLMLVSAFAGTDTILAAYAEAVTQEYRFYSYGDAMIIL